MPAAYTHILAAQRAMRKQTRWLPVKALNRFEEWMMAGAIAPDYPYLYKMKKVHEGVKWADHMHYDNTNDYIKVGVKELRQRYQIEKKSAEFQKATAWFYGYVSHVLLDVSIHPVVRAIVGDYHENPDEHRKCEIVQDILIYHHIRHYELIDTESIDYLKHMSKNKQHDMDPNVKDLWLKMLKGSLDPSEFQNGDPDLDGWHKAYGSTMDKADIDLGFLGRHIEAVLHDLAFLYVRTGEVRAEDRQKYYTAPLLPAQNRFNRTDMPYLEVFKFGVANVLRFWDMITNAIEGAGDPELPELLYWNLDTGTLKGEEKDGPATLWL